MKTLAEIEQCPKNILVPAQVAEYLNCDPHYIRLQARNKPWLLGFPVSVVGNRTKIPKAAFVAWAKGEQRNVG